LGLTVLDDGLGLGGIVLQRVCVIQVREVDMQQGVVTGASGEVKFGVAGYSWYLDVERCKGYRGMLRLGGMIDKL